MEEYKAVEQKRMFANSGLDPSTEKARNRQRRKAQRYAQKNRNKKGESKSSSSGDGAGLKGQTIFGEPQRVRAVAMNFPGVLSAQAIEDMQELMLTEAGQASSQQEGWVPTLLKYYRQMLSRKVSPRSDGHADPAGEVFGSASEWPCVDVSATPGTPPKRYSNIVVEAGTTYSNDGAACRSPGTSGRSLAKLGGPREVAKTPTRPRRGRKEKGKGKKGKEKPKKD